MKRGTKVSALAILAVIAAALAAWVWSPGVIERVVRDALEARGLENVSVRMGRPGVDGVRLSHVSFDLDDGATSARAEGIDVAYRAGGLLDGRIERVAVESLRLTRRGMDAVAAPLALPAALPGFDPVPLLAALPADGITVSRFTVAEDGGDSTWPGFSLRITRGADAASALAVATPLDPAAADRAVEVVIDRAGRVTGALAWDDVSAAPALEFSLSRDAGADAWAGRGNGEVAAVFNWLAPLLDDRLPPASCRVEFAARLAENPLDALHVDVDVSACHVGAARFAGGSVRARFMRTANGVASITPARVSLETLNAPGLSARSVVLTSGVDVDFAAAALSLPRGATLRAAGLAAGELEAGEISGRLRDSVRLAPGGTADPAVVDVDNARLVWRGDVLELTDTAVDLSLDGAGWALSAVHVGDATMTLNDTSLRARSIDVRPGAATVAVRAPRASVSTAEATASIDNVSVDVSLGGKEAESLSATADAVVVESGGYRAVLAGWSGRASWRGGDITADFDARLADAMPVSGRLRMPAGTPGGSVTIEAAPVTFGEAVDRASRLVDGLPDGIDLVNGRAGFDASVSWDEAFRASARIELDGVGGVAEDVYFSDASATLDLELYPVLRTTKTARVTIAAIDYGLVLADVEAIIGIEGRVDGAPSVVATDVRAAAFGGIVRVPRYETGVDRFDVLIDAIDLAGLVGEDRFPGLSMSGRVSGRVPVEFGDDGLYINQGLIESDGGGVLHYDPGNVGAGSGAEILFKALKEFEYSVLRVEPSYRPDGTLILGIHMEGTSEEIGRAQPIHFNVNVEQNLLKLLESLRLVDGLNEQIDRRVQQYYERQRQ